MVIGVMKKLNEVGLKVLEDVFIIGFDNILIVFFLLLLLFSIKDFVSGMINEVINRLIFMLDGGYLLNENIF